MFKRFINSLNIWLIIQKIKLSYVETLFLIFYTIELSHTCESTPLILNFGPTMRFTQPDLDSFENPVKTSSITCGF